MKIFLGGGGSGRKTTIANRAFADSIDKSKPIIYLPTAMQEGRYPKCLEWITGELGPYGINKIEMISNIYDFPKYDLSEYSGIFIGGGNTYRLLKLLKESGAYEKIKEYLRNDGIIYGGSAGSIIFGKDIEHCEYMDVNEVSLEDTTGFDILNGVNITAHYTNGTDEEMKIAHDYITEYCKKTGNMMFAIPEETAVLIDDKAGILVIGEKDCYIFETNGKEYKARPGNSVNKRTPVRAKEEIER